MCNMCRRNVLVHNNRKTLEKKEVLNEKEVLDLLEGDRGMIA